MTIARISRDRGTPAHWVLLGLTVVATIGVVAVSLFVPDLAALNIGDRQDSPVWWFPIASAILFLIPGVVVLLRAAWHPVGWVLCLLGFGFPLSFASDPASVAGLGDIQRWWLWLTNVSLSAMFWSMWCALILLFPDGLAGRRGGHRLAVAGILGTNAICVGLTATASRLAPAVEGGIASPFPVALVTPVIAGAAAFVPNLLVFAAIADFVIRYRKSEGTARQQYRWVVAAFLFLLGGLIVAGVVSGITGDETHPVWLLVIAGYMLVPVSFMLAILRYRLYDIDRIISRTVTYGLVAVLVAGVYAIPVLLLPSLVGAGSDLVVAVSTLAAAAAFNPIRRRVQRVVDRRFNRTRFETDRVVAEFSRRLRDHADLLSVAEGLESVIRLTVQPDRSALWVKDSPPVTMPERRSVTKETTW